MHWTELLKVSIHIRRRTDQNKFHHDCYGNGNIGANTTVQSFFLLLSGKREKRERKRLLIGLCRFGMSVLSIFGALFGCRKMGINYQRIVMTLVKQACAGEMISRTSRGFNACIIGYP